MNNKITACVLAFNNETEIRRCLSSLSFADEIVVIDSFSTDKTVEICKEYTDKIFQYHFESFGKLRNLMLKHASHEWIFSLDTDEETTEAVIKEIKQAVNASDSKDAYYIPRRNRIFGRWLKHGGWYPDYRQPQLYRKNAMKYHEQDDVHEGYTITGSVGYFRQAILQYPFRNLSHYLSKMERYSTLMAIRMQKENKHFKKHQVITHPLFSFIKMYFFRRGFLDGFPGFLLAISYTYYTFIKYVKLWERTHLKVVD